MRPELWKGERGRRLLFLLAFEDGDGADEVLVLEVIGKLELLVLGLGEVRRRYLFLKGHRLGGLGGLFALESGARSDHDDLNLNQATYL